MPIKQSKIDQWGAGNTPMVWRNDNVVSNPQEENNDKGNKNFDADKTPFSERLREYNAKIILSRENAIKQLKMGVYSVQSQSGVGLYKVDIRTNNWTCTCPDFKKNNHLRQCKHILALELYMQYGKDKFTKEHKKIKVNYNQSWASYNLAQSQELELFYRFLYQLVSTIEEQEQHMGRPRLKLSDQIFCCIMKIYSQLSSRRAQCLYEQALEQNQITHAPHFNVVSKTLNKNEIQPLLLNLVHISAKPLADIETKFAIDSSGFRCSSFGDYCEYFHGTKRMHNWLKVHICTGITTNIISDVIITDEHGGDSPQLKKLIQRTSRCFNIDEVMADAAYSSRKNHKIIGALGGTAYIPFKKYSKGTSKGSAIWNKAYHYFQLNREEFLEHYHKRANVESTFAAIKKKFGENIKSRNRIAQENEMLCKIISYNITVLIHAMFELGITPQFFKSL